MTDAPARERSTSLPPHLYETLAHASLAPSTHNTQPWTVRVPEPGRVVIGTTADRWLPAVDPTNRELFLSIGAFLENFTVTARHFGYNADCRLIAASATDTDLLEVRLTEARAVAFPLEKIRLRRTVRGRHLPQEIKTNDVRRLSQPLGERLVFVPRGSTAGKYLEQGTIEANRLQAGRDAAQEELSRWIRWSDDEARRFRDGLTPKSLEITGLAGWFVRHFMTQQSVMKKGFRNQSVELVRKQVKSHGGWLLVTSQDSNLQTLLETGRAVERMLLDTRERMIAIHPMSQMLEESPFREEAARELGVSGTIQFILRTGYLRRYPDPVSPRRPVAWFVRS